MLPAKKLDFCFTFGTLLCRKYHLQSTLEDVILFEHLLDSDFTFQALGFSDPSDGYIGGVRMADGALLQNFQRKALFQLHSGGTENRSNRSCRSALLPDDFTEVALSNS